MKTVWLVIPCYNEKEVLPETSKQLKQIMQDLIKKEKISSESRVAFVNDGSKDTTWNIISQLHEEDPVFVGINLAHNKGHQNALFAGLMTAKEYADAAISLDADLQDDVGAIEEFIDKFNEGKDIVYGVRSARTTDTKFKRGTAHAFYKLMKMMGADTIEDHADYRLMSKRAPISSPFTLSSSEVFAVTIKTGTLLVSERLRSFSTVVSPSSSGNITSIRMISGIFSLIRFQNFFVSSNSSTV